MFNLNSFRAENIGNAEVVIPWFMIQHHPKLEAILDAEKAAARFSFSYSGYSTCTYYAKKVGFRAYNNKRYGGGLAIDANRLEPALKELWALLDKLPE